MSHLPIEGPLFSDVPIRTIERDELRRKLEARDARFKLVMTLGAMEFKAKRIPGSLHFDSAAELLAALKKDDEIVVYCTNPACLASVAAYHRLEKEGYPNVRRYAGGIEDWENARLPTEHGDAAATQPTEAAIDDALDASFPASDPPGWSGAHAGAPRHDGRKKGDA